MELVLISLWLLTQGCKIHFLATNKQISPKHPRLKNMIAIFQGQRCSSTDLEIYQQQYPVIKANIRIPVILTARLLNLQIFKSLDNYIIILSSGSEKLLKKTFNNIMSLAMKSSRNLFKHILNECKIFRCFSIQHK